MPVLHLSHQKIFYFIQYHPQYVSGEGSPCRIDSINLWNFFKLCIHEKCTFCTYIIFRFKKFKKERHRIKMSSNYFQPEERERGKESKCGKWLTIHDRGEGNTGVHCTIISNFLRPGNLSNQKGGAETQGRAAHLPLWRWDAAVVHERRCRIVRRPRDGEGEKVCALSALREVHKHVGPGPQLATQSVQDCTFGSLSTSACCSVAASVPQALKSHPGASQESYLEAVSGAPRSRHISVKAKHH